MTEDYEALKEYFISHDVWGTYWEKEGIYAVSIVRLLGDLQNVAFPWGAPVIDAHYVETEELPFFMKLIIYAYLHELSHWGCDFFDISFATYEMIEEGQRFSDILDSDKSMVALIEAVTGLNSVEADKTL